MPLVLFLCSFLPPARDCQRELVAAEEWQSALYLVLDTPHDAHDESAERVDFWQRQLWAHCNGFTLENRTWFLGECFALMAGRALR